MLRSAGASLLQLLKPSVLSGAEFQASKRFLNYFDAPNGPAVKQVDIEDEWYNRQRSVLPILHKAPLLQPCTWIAPNAVVAGDVDFYDKVSVFFGAVIRGDLNKIRIGYNSNILDRVVIHSARAIPTGLNPATLIGDNVTIEPFSILRACRVNPKVLIGARSVVCEGAIIESESILAPGSVVPPARRIPSGELWGGNPAKFIRKLTDNERERVIEETALFYRGLAESLRKEEHPYGTQWRQVEAWRQKQVQTKEYEWVNFREQKYLMRLQQEAEAMSKLTQ